MHLRTTANRIDTSVRTCIGGQKDLRLNSNLYNPIWCFVSLVHDASCIMHHELCMLHYAWCSMHDNAFWHDDARFIMHDDATSTIA